MPKITFTTSDGKKHVVDAQVGNSVMEAAIENDVPGIDADCGGCCSCATCHVWVDQSWMAKVGAPEEMESDMLEINDERRDTSRLSCQIEVTEDLDGLEVEVPEFQM